MVQTKVPDKDKIQVVLTVKEFLGFVTAKIIKNGFTLVASFWYLQFSQKTKEKFDFTTNWLIGKFGKTS